MFRDIEHENAWRGLLGSASERDARMVLALGGGTFAQPRNVALLRVPGSTPRSSGAAIIWLDCRMEALLQRCVLMGDRPLFRGKPVS